jgi:hypothetical protein
MEPDFRERMARDEGPWVEFIKTMKREKSGGDEKQSAAEKPETIG